MITKHHTACSLCVALGFLLLLMVSSGCAESRELTRSRALTLIKESERFSQPARLALEGVNGYPMRQIPDDATDEQARALAIAIFLADTRLMAVCHHLGLATADATIKQKGGPYTQQLYGTSMTSRRAWEFDITMRLTAKGKEMAGEKTNSLPMSVPEVMEVTGVTQGQNGEAQAEFTWRSNPTVIGEALDPSTDTHKALPEKLRKEITTPAGLFGNKLARDFKIVAKGVAYFKRYDDGWRLTDTR